AFLDQAWDPDAADLEWIRAYPARWAAEQFGPAHAQAIGDILTRYTRLNARRKPELIDAATWSLVHDREAGHVLSEWDALVAQVQALAPKIPASHRDAWYQLVEYPVLASANLNHLHVAVARNRLYAAQGRASANAWAEQARKLFARDAELQRVYEQEIAGGKWIHMMSQPRIGYTHWQSPPRNILPALASVDAPAKGVTGVAVEGDPLAYPALLKAPRLPELDPVAAPTREAVVVNRGQAPIAFNATSRAPAGAGSGSGAGPRGGGVPPGPGAARLHRHQPRAVAEGFPGFRRSGRRAAAQAGNRLGCPAGRPPRGRGLHPWPGLDRSLRNRAGAQAAAASRRARLRRGRRRGGDRGRALRARGAAARRAVAGDPQPGPHPVGGRRLAGHRRTAGARRRRRAPGIPGGDARGRRGRAARAGLADPGRAQPRRPALRGLGQRRAAATGQ